MKKTTREAAVAPVSDLVRKNGTLPSETGSSLCDSTWASCGSTVSTALGEKIGGSKVKRDKGSMPGEPGNSRFTPPGNAGRGLGACYGFGFWLRSVCNRAENP